MSKENLSRLSNHEIHLLMVEYGLPNIPVTDTTRKVLIAKLSTAIVEGRRRSNLMQSQTDEDENQSAEEMQDARRAVSGHDALEHNLLNKASDHRRSESPNDSDDRIPVVVEKIRGRRDRCGQTKLNKPPAPLFSSSMQFAFYMFLIGIVTIGIYHIILD